MQNLLRDIGFQEHLYEDFVEETLDLLRDISVANGNGAGLLAVFNDSVRSQSIITYLKVCTPNSASAFCSLLTACQLALNKWLDTKASGQLCSILGDTAW